MILPLLRIKHFITVIKIKINMLGGTQNATLIKNQNITNVHKNQLYQSRVKSIVVYKNIANNQIYRSRSKRYNGMQKYNN